VQKYKQKMKKSIFKKFFIFDVIFVLLPLLSLRMKVF